MEEDTVCDGSHEHLHLRGTGPGGSRTAQSALYPDALCDDWLHEIVPEVSEGGRYVDGRITAGKEVAEQHLDVKNLLEKLIGLKTVAKDKGLLSQWNTIVEPWIQSSGISSTSTTGTSSTSQNPERAATGITGVTDIFKGITGEIKDEPWQNKKYTKESALWQAAAQRRHMHRRHKNQSLGVCSVDLSGPHEGTPQPGLRISSSQAHYFLVLTAKFGEAKTTEEPPPEAPPETPDTEDASKEDPPLEDEKWVSPILYAALLERKSDAPKRIQGILAQVRAEFGGMPEAGVSASQ